MAKHRSHRSKWRKSDEMAQSSAGMALWGLLCNTEIEIGVWNMGVMH